MGQWDSSRECWSPSPGSAGVRVPGVRVGLVPGVLESESREYEWDSSRECWSSSPGSTSGTVGLVPGVLESESREYEWDSGTRPGSAA